MSDFFDNKIIIIIISIIWGLGIAIMFRKVCKNDQCVTVKVPMEFENGNKIIYDQNKKCYQLGKYFTDCED